MIKSKYHLLEDEESPRDVELRDAQISKTTIRHRLSAFCHERHIQASWQTIALALALGVSIAGNAVFLLHNRRNSSVCRSQYAGLLNNVEKPMRWDTAYSNPNETERNALWYLSEDADKGIIALDNTEAQKLGLPPSQPFVWDTTKSIYISNAHHQLHCLRDLYISIDQYHTNVSQTTAHQHLMHCFSTLGKDIICAADDTLRYVPMGPDDDGQVRPGEGQLRTCRDWSQMEKYVTKHSGCYRYDGDVPEIERWKFCPNDSKYLPKIREYFGLAEDWLPWS